MRTLARQCAVILIILTAIIPNGSPSDRQVLQAQNSDLNIPGKLIYVRQIPNVRAEIVSKASTNSQTFIVPIDKCTDISNDGTYIATTSMSREDMVIRLLDTQQIVLQRPWASEWLSCGFYWSLDTRVSIIDQSVNARIHDMDITTGVVTIFDPTPPPPTTYPQLPNWIPGHKVLQSPDGNKFYYDRCTGGQTETTSGRIRCVTPIDWVIYDVSQQTTLVILTDVPTNSYEPLGGATWSPDGRYLAYLRNRDFPLRIYDTVAGQLLDTSGLGGIPVDERKGLYWSPDVTKVAMWAEGRMNEPLTGDNPNTLRRLVWFNVTQSGRAGYTAADIPHDMPIGYAGGGKWSPDSQVFAYVNQNAELIYVDANSGVTTVLDTNVDRIVVWKTGTLPLPTATPKQ